MRAAGNAQARAGAALLGSAAVSLWLSKSLIRAVQERLAAGCEGATVVWEFPLMSRALRQAGCELAELPETGQAKVAALIVDGQARREGWAETLASLRSRLQPGGQLLTVDKGPAEEVSRRLLCAGLSDLRQCVVGRRLLTSAIRPLQ